MRQAKIQEWLANKNLYLCALQPKKISPDSNSVMNNTPSFAEAIEKICSLKLEDTAIATLRSEKTLKFFDKIEKQWLPGNGEKTGWAFLRIIGARLMQMPLEDRQLLFGNKTQNHFEALKRLDDVLASATCEVHFQLTCPKHEPFNPHPLSHIAKLLPETAEIRFSSRYIFTSRACHIKCDTGMTLLDWLDESVIAAGYPASVFVKICPLGQDTETTLQTLITWLDAYSNLETRQDANSGRFIGQDKPDMSDYGKATPDGKGIIGYAPDGFFTHTSVHDCDMKLNGRRESEMKPLCSVSDYPNPGNGHVLLVSYDARDSFVKHFKVPCQNLSEQDWECLVELNDVDLRHGVVIPLCYSLESAKRIREHAFRLAEIVKDCRMAGPLPPNHLKDCHYLFSFNF